MLTDKQIKHWQMYRQNYANFERNLAMMVIYLPVKSEFDWTKLWGMGISDAIFYLESGNANVDRRTSNTSI